MSINVSGNIISNTGFNSSGEILNSANIITDGLVLWLDAGNLSSYNNSSNYYDCGYGCQYYASNPGCTNCNTQWKDMSGLGNDGTLGGGTIINYDNTGGSMYFDATDNYVDVTNSLGTLSTYSICYWALRYAGGRMPISSRTSTNFYWYSDSSWRYVHGGVGGEYYYPKSVSIPDNVWGYYCVSYDGSNVNIYRQGVYEGQQATTGTAVFTDGLKIGYWYNAGATYAYSGLISVVQFYNKALSAPEITQNFNTDRQRFGI